MGKTNPIDLWRGEHITFNKFKKFSAEKGGGESMWDPGLQGKRNSGGGL